MIEPAAGLNPPGAGLLLERARGATTNAAMPLVAILLRTAPHRRDPGMPPQAAQRRAVHALEATANGGQAGLKGPGIRFLVLSGA